MQPSRAPLYVFLAAFLTFLLAFATLCAVVKPVLDQQRPDATTASPSIVAPTGDVPADRSAPPHSDERPRPATAAAPVIPTTVQITGRAVDPRGDPVKQARAHLLVRHAETGDAALDVVASEAADSDGRFALTGELKSRSAFLLVIAPGFFRSERCAVAARAKVDVGALTLRPAATLTVRVSSDEGNLLAGAKVELADNGRDPEPLRRAALAATTDRDGNAAIRGVDSGDYLVHVSAPGHADAELKWRCDAAAKSAAAEVGAVLLPLVGFVSGAVFDADRTPVTQGEVAARLVHPDPPAPQEWRATLNGSGEFRIGPLPRGSFEVELVSPGLVQSAHVFGECDGDSVELTAEYGGVVSGRFEAPQHSLRSEPKLTLWKCDAAGHMQPFDGVCRATANANALTFRVDGLGPGRYVARAAAAGFAPARSQPFDLAAGATVDDVVVPLGDGGSITGAVNDTRGAPLVGARVTAFEGSVAPASGLTELFPADARTTQYTGEDGSFTLELLSPGPQVLVLEAQGQPPRTFGPLWIDEHATAKLGTVLLGAGGILCVTLDDSGGRPVPFGRARLTNRNETISVLFVADEQGNFCLRGLVAGSYALSALADPSRRVEVDVADDSTHRVDFALTAR